MSDERRRQIRVAHEVFDRLDEILGTERGPLNADETIEIVRIDMDFEP